MRKITFLLFLCCSSLLQSQYKNELRGVWITNVDSYVYNSDKNIATAMDYLASIGINVIFPVVWNNGYTLYPSKVMQYYFEKPISSSFYNRDPLDKIVIEAHRNGIEVIPWFEYGFATTYSSSNGHILDKYPQWGLKNKDGNFVVTGGGFHWMSGINPDVQKFIISLITEVIDNYDVDGVQGDDRLPAMPVEGGYDSVTVNIYKSENNGLYPPISSDPNWIKWRANKLNLFFKQLKDSVKIRNKNLILSAAPSVYPWGYDNYLQDSRSWLENDIIDNFIPQIYRNTFSSYSSELLKSLSYTPSNKKNLFFSGVLAKSGIYIIDPKFLIDCISYNRSNNVNGECFFFYEALKANNSLLGDTLHSLFYSQPATLPYRNSIIWRPKALIVNEDDPSIIKSGKWITYPQPGFKTNILWTNDTNYASISYNFDVPSEDYYSIYFYSVPNSILNTTRAHYTVYANDSTNIVLDQSNPKMTGWIKLTDVYLKKGVQKILMLDNKNIEPGKYIIADAVMLMVNRKYARDIPVTSIKDNVARSCMNEIKTINLLQNYPNPFNSITRIQFKISTKENSTQVLLEIFDLLGRKIKTLLHQNLKNGEYSIAFDAENFTSGIYYYRLTTPFDTQTKSMQLIK